MLGRLLPIFLLFFSVFSLESHASQVCNSIPEYQYLIEQAQTRIQELSTTDDLRVSTTGAVFTRDASVPAFGEAYRDPSGLIWGSIVIAQGEVNTEYDADRYCKDRGGRLPTAREFQQLANYLGKGSALGYSPYLAYGKKIDFLPGLSSYWFWSWSDNPNHSYYAYYFNGYTGYFTYFLIRDVSNSAVRCVAGR